MGRLRRALGAPEVRSSRRLPALSGTSTSSSVSVSPERSLQIGAVYSCVRLLSEAVAGLPVELLEEQRDGSTRPVKRDPVLSLVSDAPNPVIDAGELWRTVIGWMLLRGNAYVFIERNGAGQPVGLWPIAPTSVDVKRIREGDNAGQLVYAVELADDEYAPLPGGARRYNVRAENMLHYRAFGLGVEGLSPIGLARQSVGIAFAAQSYVGGFFARDASPGGIVSVEGELTDAQYERLELQWRQLHEGYDNAHKLAVMEGGATWEKTTLSPADAQFIETQKFSRSEIASIYGVLPHMIGDTDKSTSWGSGLEVQGKVFVTYSLRPWLQRLERVTRRRLLGNKPARRFRWDPAGLMQGDLAARYEAYATGKQWGWLSTNDIKRKEGEAPVDGGDVYLQPLNMVPAGTVPGAANARSRRRARRQERAADDATAAAWIDRHIQLLRDAFERQRDDALANGGKLDRAKWDEELAGILLAPTAAITEEFASRVAAEFGADYDLSLTSALLSAIAAQRARNLNITTEEDLARKVAEADDAESAIDEVFDLAVEARAVTASRSYVSHTVQLAKKEGGLQAGAKTKRWVVTSSNPRKSHARMDGEEVGIDERFSNGAMWPGDSEAGVDETAGCTCEVQILA